MPAVTGMNRKTDTILQHLQGRSLNKWSRRIWQKWTKFKRAWKVQLRAVAVCWFISFLPCLEGEKSCFQNTVVLLMLQRFLGKHEAKMCRSHVQHRHHTSKTTSSATAKIKHRPPILPVRTSGCQAGDAPYTSILPSVGQSVFVTKATLSSRENEGLINVSIRLAYILQSDQRYTLILTFSTHERAGSRASSYPCSPITLVSAQSR